MRKRGFHRLGVFLAAILLGSILAVAFFLDSLVAILALVALAIYAVVRAIGWVVDFTDK
jgi:hypothetical protein